MKKQIIILFLFVPFTVWSMSKVVLGFNTDPSLIPYRFPCLQSYPMNVITCNSADIYLSDKNCEKTLKFKIINEKKMEISCIDVNKHIRFLGRAHGELVLDELSQDGMGGVPFTFSIEAALVGKEIILK